jgi:DnaJ family protein C protein 7
LASNQTAEEMPTPKESRESLRQGKDMPVKNSRRLSDKPDRLLQRNNPQQRSFTSRSTTAISETVGAASLRSKDQPPRSPLTKEALEALDQENKRPRHYLKPAPSEAPMRKSKKTDKKKSKPEKNSHPLNLPPDELRQLSAAMAEANANNDAMDIDTPQVPESPKKTSPPTTPFQSAPGAFPDSTTNGDTNGVNGHEDEKSPTPPPHKEPPPPPVDAEACKAAGNKFFKAKDYLRAITEYSKGTNMSES